MTTILRSTAAILALSTALAPCRAVELTITRQALEHTLRQQLFNTPNGRYYLKGNAQSGCSISAEDPHLIFKEDRIVVTLKTHAKVGKSVGGACLGMALNFPAEVSLVPDAEGESVGFRDAHLDKVSNNSQVDFVLGPFMRRQVPSSMKINAAELLRKALANSSATAGYKVTLTRLRINSIVIHQDSLVVDVDGDLNVE